MKYYVLLLSFLIPCNYLQSSKSSTKCAGITPMMFHKKQNKMPQYQSISEQLKPRLKKINHAFDQQLFDVISSEDSAKVVRLFSGNEIPDANARDWANATPLMRANHLVDVVKLLIDAGANVNAKGGSWNAPVLSHAAFAANPTIIKMLVNAGADLNATDDQGMTALMQAAMQSNHYPDARDYALIIKILLQAGANPYMSNTGETRKTALDYATRPEIKKIFIDFEKLQTPQNKKSLRTAAQNIIAGKFPQTHGGQEDPGKRIQEFLRPTLAKQEEIKNAAQSE